MTLSALEPRRAGDFVQNLHAMFARRLTPHFVGRDPIYIPLSDPNLPDLMTLTRGGPLPYYRIADDADGERWVECTDADQPRIYSADGTRVRSGLLIEQPADNQCFRSRSLNSAPWAGVNSPTVRVNEHVAPDGAMSAEEVEDDSVGNIEEQFQIVGGNFIVTDNVIYSMFGRELPGGGTVASITLNQDAGVLTTQLDSSVWVRRFLEGTINGVTADVRVDPGGRTAADIGTAAYWGGQIELGKHPTSFIAAGASAVHRNGETGAISILDLQQQVTAARGRVRFLWIPGFANDETTGNKYCLRMSGDPLTGLTYEATGDLFRFYSNASPVVQSGAATFGRYSSVFFFDITWAGATVWVDIFQDGTLFHSGSGAWTPPNTFQDDSIFLGGLSGGAQVATGIFRELALG